MARGSKSERESKEKQKKSRLGGVRERRGEERFHSSLSARRCVRQQKLWKEKLSCVTGKKFASSSSARGRCADNISSFLTIFLSFPTTLLSVALRLSCLFVYPFYVFCPFSKFG